MTSLNVGNAGLARKNALIIIGAGGHGKVVLGTALAAGFEMRGWVDDSSELRGKSVQGFPVLGGLSDLPAEPGVSLVLALGNNRVRKEFASRLRGRDFATVIHPSAIVHPSVRLGEGTVVFAGAILQPDAQVGVHVIVNTGAQVDHDGRIGDFAHLCPKSCLAGNVMIGEGTMMGTASCAIPGVRVADWVRVGAGAAVVSDLPEGVTAVGVPARFGNRRKLT